MKEKKKKLKNEGIYRFGEAAASFGNIRFIFEKEKREERKGCDKDMAPREGMYF